MASKKAAKGNEDRISCLPEGVLIHILSFLPTIYSVRTSILSTRWKHLFTFVPNLDFHYSTNTSVQDFIYFVNYVFVLYNSPRLNNFSLHFHTSAQLPNFPCPIILWISAAILRNVSKINISFDFGGRRTLPFDLFSCKTLTILEIKGNFYVALPRSAWLPNLKTCSFRGVSFSEESALELFQNCPKLETLEIITCHMGQGLEVLDISVPKLKRLIMHETVDNYQIRLDAPNLLYFKYMGPASISISKIDSLNSSRDDACVWYRSGLYTRNRIIRDLVQEDYNVRQLHLSRDTMEAFVLSSKLFPIFKNLTRLSLGSISSISSELVLYLLDKSPQLTYLSFSQGSVDDNNEADHGYVLQEGVPKCVANHIKAIRFCCFSMFEYDFKILKNASVLDKLTIQSSLSCELQLAIVKKVTALPRCSTACKVIFE